MSAISRADVEAVVTPEGSVVVPTPRRRNMYGALAGKVPDVSPEEIADELRQAWVTWRSAGDDRRTGSR